MIVCPTCGEAKPRDAFLPIWPRRRDCRLCINQKKQARRNLDREGYLSEQRSYYAANKDKRAANKREKLYGLAEEDFLALLESQNGQCAICARPMTFGRAESGLSVDHDHETSQVRGLLCQRCNLMLGKACDSIEILQSAIQYLMLVRPPLYPTNRL